MSKGMVSQLEEVKLLQLFEEYESNCTIIAPMKARLKALEARIKPFEEANKELVKQLLDAAKARGGTLFIGKYVATVHHREGHPRAATWVQAKDTLEIKY